MKKFTRILCLALVAVMLCATLASCGGPASNPDDAVAALKENGYTAAKDTLIVPAALKLAGVKDIDTVISGTKIEEDVFETITVIYFTDSDAAEAAFEKVESYASEKKDDKAEESNWVVEQSGAMIYFGTKQAVKDAK